MRGNLYQYTLIALGVVATAFLGVFFYRELFPEYKIYQNDYIALEQFRSTYTHEEPPLFKTGVKQILIEKSDKGNPTIDRCISCHVALEFPHFSPTKIEHDINGNIVVDAEGMPRKVKNDDYVWGKVDQKIAELEDAQVNAQIRSEGDTARLKHRQNEAQKLKNLKVAHVDEHTFDVTKVLAMHPLMGKETRPFEFHPMEEYGCTSCHNGNGRGLTTLTAHGPVFDGQFEKEFMGPVPQFTEIDPANDPPFAHIFNGKPGHELLFQTTPIYVGALIEAKCMQCHQSSSKALESAVDTAGNVTLRRRQQSDAIVRGLKNDKLSVLSLLSLQKSVETSGVKPTLRRLEEKSQNYTLPADEREHAAAQLAYLSKVSGSPLQKEIETRLSASLQSLLGSPKLVGELAQSMTPSLALGREAQEKALDTFIQKVKGSPEASGSLFSKLVALDLERQIEQHINDLNTSFRAATEDQTAIAKMRSDIDQLTTHYQRGEKLFIAESCYACHRIAGFARGGVGPELTQSGEGYPWYVKESIVWPQADLKTSTMPNFGLDHEELEDLVTYLLGQTGGNKTISPTAYKAAMQEWEAGRKLPWEKPISPGQMHDLRFAMTTFATEGCAACHRLKGYDSNVGFAIEKQSPAPSFAALQAERNWFEALIPEEITGTALVKAAEEHALEIDARIAENVRTQGLLEEIEASHPGIIETYYTPFKFATRAKDAHYRSLEEKETDPTKHAEIRTEWRNWKQRIHRLMLMYAQEYGVGRLIGPRPNWSGLFRSDEWLMEHFKNPAAHVPRSIMPVFPFDETKFYALTRMLDTLALRNRDETRAIWEHQGFNPERAYHIHCAQCHGDFRQGNGPVATWIYPIPKNLRNAEFLRNLTKERAINSITHGVHGTPMPPFGEVAADKTAANGIPELTQAEIVKLVDWLFASLPGGNVIRSSEDVPKWNYTPEDLIKELKDEGSLEELKKSPPAKGLNHSKASPLDSLPRGENLWAALSPSVPISNEATELFDVVQTSSALTPQEYYIKKKYYTAKNIDEGRHYFELNCTVCHGKDADGAGMRAGSMAEAKPRMLTNLDWIKSHDDLRLLQSIKYGVAGTAMNPWGDFTSALQRMQLVMFIRSLTEERTLRDELMESLYTTFDAPELALDLVKGNDSADNQHIIQLKSLIKKERELYLSSGLELIQNGETESLHKLIQLIQRLADRFQIDGDHVTYRDSDAQEKEVAEHQEQILQQISDHLASALKNKALLEGKLPSAEEIAKQQEANARLTALTKLKNNVTFAFAEAARLREQEKLAVATPSPAPSPQTTTQETKNG